MRVKKIGDTKLRNRTKVFGSILLHMSEGIGRNGIVRDTKLKPDVVDRNIRKLIESSFIVRLDQGKGRISPFFVHPDLIGLGYDDFEKKCHEAGLFLSGGHLFIGEGMGRPVKKRILKGPTMGDSYESVRQDIRFFIGMPKTLGAAKPGSGSHRRRRFDHLPRNGTEVAEPVTRFTPKQTIKNIQAQANSSLMFFLKCWLSSLLRRKPMDVFDLAKNAPLGGKPLTRYLVVAVVESMKDEGLGLPDADGRWHLTKKGYREIPDLYA